MVFRKNIMFFALGISLCCSMIVADENSITPDLTSVGSSSEKNDQQVKSEKPNLLDFDTKDLNFDPQELQKIVLKIFDDYKQKVFEQKRQMRQALPEELSHILDKASEAYASFAEQVSISNVLIIRCERVRTNLADAQKEGTFPQKEGSDVLNALEKLQSALVDGSFSSLLQAPQTGATLPMNPFDMSGAMAMLGGMPGMNGIRLGEPFQEKDLIDLNEKLNALQPYLEKEQKSVAAYSFLQKILQALQKKDFDAVVAYQLEHLIPYLEKTFVSLHDAMSRFELYLKKNLQESDGKQGDKNELSEAALKAIEYWYKELEGFTKTLRLFDSLQKSVSLGDKKRLKFLFKWLTYGYDLYSSLFNKYQNDFQYYHDKHTFLGNTDPFYSYKKYVFMPELMNPILKISLSAWYYFDAQSDSKKGILYNLTLGDKQIHSLSKLEVITGDLFAAVPAIIMFFGWPSILYWQPGKLLQSYGNIAVSWLYYHALFSNLFEKFDADSQASKQFLWWPNGSKDLKKALFDAATQTNQTLIREFTSYKIREKIDPFVLDKIERFSMGVVKPEMIGDMFHIFMPFLFRKAMPASVGEFFTWDVQSDFAENFLMKHKKGEMNLGELARFFNNFDRLKNNLYSGFSSKDVDAILNKYAQKYNINLDAYYIEQRIFCYICSSIGSYWGRILTKKYSSTLGKIFAKGSDLFWGGLEKIRLVPQGTLKSWQDGRNDIVAEFDQYKMMIKEMLKMSLLQSGGPKGTIVDVLVEKGYIQKGETNEIVLNQSILKVIINFLFRYQLLTAFDASLILNELRSITVNNEIQAFETFGSVVDKLVESTIGNIFPLFGSFIIGSWFSDRIAKGISNKYGPFYKKIL
ncbi:MAG: hypothetical protein V1855_04190 [bacterium]